MQFQGLYVGEVADQGREYAKTGTPQIVLKCRVLSKIEKDGSYTAVGDAIERTIWMSLTEKTKGFVAKDLQSIGFTGQPSQIQLDRDNAIDLRGSEVRLWCKQETGMDGQARERWSISRPRETRPVTPVAAGDASRIDAMFGDAFGSTAAAPVQQAGERITPLNL